MEVVLLVVQLFVALALIIVILIQPAESSQLGGLGGSNPMAGVGTRSQANGLTRATGILATLFIIISLALAILAGNNRSSASILDSAEPVNAALPPQAKTGEKDMDAPAPVPVPNVDSQTPPAPDVPAAK